MKQTLLWFGPLFAKRGFAPFLSDDALQEEPINTRCHDELIKKGGCSHLFEDGWKSNCSTCKNDPVPQTYLEQQRAQRSYLTSFKEAKEKGGKKKIVSVRIKLAHDDTAVNNPVSSWWKCTTWLVNLWKGHISHQCWETSHKGEK